MNLKLAPFAGLACAVIGATSPAEARPVSYPEGWTVMQMNNGDMSSLHVHYSPTAKDSVGLYIERNWELDTQFTGLQYNRLVKRWNAPKSQGNLYFKAGAGEAQSFDGLNTDLAGFIGVAADWETRRWFIGYEARAYDFGFDQTARQSARVGVAPYIGDFGDLHTWLMVEVENMPEADSPVLVTPLVRLFKGVQLVEVGYTPETNRFMFNYILRF